MPGRINNPQRPSFEAWWQHARGWRRAPGNFGRLAYAIGYDIIGDAAATGGFYFVFGSARAPPLGAGGEARFSAAQWGK
jgi:hypothetical protein